jgi:F-type H+-transporting ATPase subunit gamma
MPNVKEIKNRIKSIQNIQQITKAMKMIASARIKKSDRLLRARRPFCASLLDFVHDVVTQFDEARHGLLEEREIRKIGVLVITGDKGLCGAYNVNVMRRAERFLKNPPEGKKVLLYVVGTKAMRYFSRRFNNIEKHYVSWEPTDELAEEMANFFSEEFARGAFDELVCFYTQSVSLMTQQVTDERILPLPLEEKDAHIPHYILEPWPEALLNILLPYCLRELLVRILLDARTAELSARINAMSNATENAEKFVDELRLNYFRARQETITTEILEITSGAEAFKKG